MFSEKMTYKEIYEKAYKYISEKIKNKELKESDVIFQIQYFNKIYEDKKRIVYKGIVQAYKDFLEELEK